jgi:hypothetical protein
LARSNFGQAGPPAAPGAPVLAKAGPVGVHGVAERQVFRGELPSRLAEHEAHLVGGAPRRTACAPSPPPGRRRNNRARSDGRSWHAAARSPGQAR